MNQIDNFNIFFVSIRLLIYFHPPTSLTYSLTRCQSIHKVHTQSHKPIGYNNGRWNWSWTNSNHWITTKKGEKYFSFYYYFFFVKKIVLFSASHAFCAIGFSLTHSMTTWVHACISCRQKTRVGFHLTFNTVDAVSKMK